MAIDPLTGLMSQPTDIQQPGVQQFGAPQPVTNPTPTGLMTQPPVGYTANQLSTPTKWNVEDNQTYWIEIFDISGTSVLKVQKSNQDQFNLGNELVSGLYLVQITNDKGQAQSIKWIKQ